MTETVAVPLWLFLLILAFAATAFLSHFLFPSVRWFFRRRMERAVAQLNTRLDRPIDPFKLMERQDMIARLSYDPKVMEAVVEQAHNAGEPESVTFERARAYAREIVPSFSANVYFGFATRAARWLSRLLYRVEVGHIDDRIGQIDRQAAVIFVMNHRSNMDYVLVTWLVADRSAISYAVGEWARVWPLSALIRASGAYFIRRKSLTTLYRRVLARYLQITTAEGATQAIFPEGGLSLDGRVGPAKLGLLGYIVSGFDVEASRDVVFVPVGLAYDRVLEDRLLVEAQRSGVRRFRARPLAILSFVGRMIGRKLIGRFPGFGSAAVAFGAPLSLRDVITEMPLATPEAQTALLGERLMSAVMGCVPLLPVPLVAAAVAEGAVSRDQVLAWVTVQLARLEARGAVTGLALDEVVEEGMRALFLRGIIAEDAEAGLRVVDEKADILSFYAAAVLQRLERSAH